MKRILYILSAVLFVCCQIACSNEDDISEIFVGRTWYMNGATINGRKLNDEIKNFYTQAGETAYYIAFSSGTFQGALSVGVTFSGTWSADGKNQAITIRVTNEPSIETPFDTQIFNIFTNASTYSSGADFLQLNADDHNQIVFGNSRSKIYN